MSAIEHRQTAVMGGNVEARIDCGHWRVACNSYRNRHCPRCQGAVGYFHVVSTLRGKFAAIALQNKTAFGDCSRRLPKR